MERHGDYGSRSVPPAWPGVWLGGPTDNRSASDAGATSDAPVTDASSSPSSPAGVAGSHPSRDQNVDTSPASGRQQTAGIGEVPATISEGLTEIGPGGRKSAFSLTGSNPRTA